MTDPTEEAKAYLKDDTERELKAKARQDALLSGEMPAAKPGDFLLLSAYHLYLADGGFRLLSEVKLEGLPSVEEIQAVSVLTQTETLLANGYAMAGDLAVRIKMMELAGINAKADLTKMMADMELNLFNSTKTGSRG